MHIKSRFCLAGMLDYLVYFSFSKKVTPEWLLHCIFAMPALLKQKLSDSGPLQGQLGRGIFILQSWLEIKASEILSDAQEKSKSPQVVVMHFKYILVCCLSRNRIFKVALNQLMLKGKLEAKTAASLQFLKMTTDFESSLSFAVWP